MLALQPDPDLAEACGQTPSWICEKAFDLTGSEDAAELADLVFGTLARIVLIVLVAWLLNLFVRRAIKRFTAGMANSAAADNLQWLKRKAPAAVAESSVFSTRAAARAKTLGNVLRSFASFGIWSIAVITILGELGLNLGPLVASAGIAGVALGFGAQSLVKDVLSGVFMLVEDQYGVGDIVDLGQASGTVEGVSLRVTRLRDTNGTVWHVPNGAVQRVGNLSQQWARALLDIRVAYDTDIEAAQRVIKEVADGLWHDPAFEGTVLEEPEVWGVEELAPDAVKIRLVIKTQPAAQFKVMRELRGRVLAAFEEHGIEIPVREEPPVTRN